MSLFPASLFALSATLLEEAKARGLMLATAESCTGGLVSACLTEVAGSSAIMERSFVTYTNQAKIEMLGVRAELIADHGAVSDVVAMAMATGALARSHAHLAVSITGVAGPGGGTRAKPVGLVHFGMASQKAPVMSHEERFGAIGRDKVRIASVEVALNLLLQGVRETG